MPILRAAVTPAVLVAALVWPAGAQERPRAWTSPGGLDWFQDESDSAPSVRYSSRSSVIGGVCSSNERRARSVRGPSVRSYTSTDSTA